MAFVFFEIIPLLTKAFCPILSMSPAIKLDLCLAIFSILFTLFFVRNAVHNFDLMACEVCTSLKTYRGRVRVTSSNGPSQPNPLNKYCHRLVSSSTVFTDMGRYNLSFQANTRPVMPHDESDISSILAKLPTIREDAILGMTRLLSRHAIQSSRQNIGAINLDVH